MVTRFTLLLLDRIHIASVKQKRIVRKLTRNRSARNFCVFEIDVHQGGNHWMKATHIRKQNFPKHAAS
jgi:hypothetical protein